MSDVSEFLKRISKRTGFKRQFYIEKNMPTDPSDILIIPFFGDIRSTFVLSSLLLRSYKDANKDKYIILCSWPGFQNLFSYVDEYWTIDDEYTIKTLATTANNLYNNSTAAAEITRSLIEVANVLTVKELKDFYDNGFTKKYWDSFGEIKLSLPEIPSISVVSNDLKIQLNKKERTKIVVYPAIKMKSWQHGKTELLPITKEFWISLIRRLIKEGFDPVVYQNNFTHDVSVDLLDECTYLVSKNLSEVLAVFRYVGLVLDVHSGISRLAIAARCPFIAVTERQIFIQDKDYEIDDLCADDLPRQYVFAFSTQLMVGGPDEWDISVTGNIVNRLKKFTGTINHNNLPSTTSTYCSIPYSIVRQKKAKRLGAAFIKKVKK